MSKRSRKKLRHKTKSLIRELSKLVLHDTRLNVKFQAGDKSIIEVPSARITHLEFGSIVDGESLRIVGMTIEAHPVYVSCIANSSVSGTL